MKKIIPLLSGLAAGVLILLIIPELLKGLAGLLFGLKVTFDFLGFYLNTNIEFVNTIPDWQYIFIYSIPLLTALVLSEAAFIFLAKAKSDTFKIFLLIFILIMIGYIIINLLLAILAVVFPLSLANSWTELFKLLNYAQSKQLLFMMLFLFLIFIYINFLSRRLRKNIPMIHQINKKGSNGIKK